MTIRFTSPSGAAAGTGLSRYAPLSLDRVAQLSEAGDTIRCLPGTYRLTAGFDFSLLTEFMIEGEGLVIWDGSSTVDLALRIGSTTTVAGIRFRNFEAAIEVVDGSQDTLIIDCFDDDVSSALDGYSFKALDVTGVTFKNLTSRRPRDGIIVRKGVTLRNCLATGTLGFQGDIIDRFETADTWVRTVASSSAVFSMTPQFAHEGDESLYIGITNNDGGSTRVGARRVVGASLALDFSTVDRAILELYIVDSASVVAGADSVRVTIASPGGTNRFDFDASVLVDEEYLVLQLDLTAPAATSGTIDLADIRTLELDFLVGAGQSVFFAMDNLQLLDSTVIADFNAVMDFGGSNPMALFRGSNGIDPVALPPPFASPARLDYRYALGLPNYETYVTGGYENGPIGALWQGALIYSSEAPGHLRFNDHRILGRWYNDEAFFNSSTGQPGAEGEGLSESLDETGATVTELNIDTVNLIDSVDSSHIRDADDSKAWLFDAAAGALTSVGLTITLAAPVDLTGKLGSAAELRIPDLTNVSAAGLEIEVHSAGGYVVGRLPKTGLVVGWNEVTVLFGSPFSTSGAFDESAVTHYNVRLYRGVGTTITGLIFDHISTILIEGASTGPIEFDANGRMGFDFATYPESDVARAINDPALATDIGSVLKAFWLVNENADVGVYVNIRRGQQLLGTREIEVRWSEHKFGRTAASLQGAIAQDWTPISRATQLLLGDFGRGADTNIRGLRGLWIQARMVLRTRAESFGIVDGGGLGWGDHEWDDSWGGTVDFASMWISSLFLAWDPSGLGATLELPDCRRAPRSDLCDYFPEMYCREDQDPDVGGTGDHHRLLEVLADFLYGTGIDVGIADMIESLICLTDANETEERFLDAMLLHLGFDLELPLSARDKRRIIPALVPLYKRRGTTPGIEEALLLLLGIPVEIFPKSGQGFDGFECGEPPSPTLSEVTSTSDYVVVTNPDRFELGATLFIIDQAPASGGPFVSWTPTEITDLVADRVYFAPQVLSGPIPVGAFAFCDRLNDILSTDANDGKSRLGADYAIPTDQAVYALFVDVQRTVTTTTDLEDGDTEVDVTSTEFIVPGTRIRVTDGVAPLQVETVIQVREVDGLTLRFHPISLAETIESGAQVINLFTAEELDLILRVVQFAKPSYTFPYLTRDLGLFAAVAG